MNDDTKGTDGKSVGPNDLLAGVFLSIEHGYLCIRNENGWLLWSAQTKAGNEHSLTGIIAQVENNQRAWLADQDDEPPNTGDKPR